MGASGAQPPAGGVEREEVGGVEAGEDELRLGGDAAEAGDAAAEVDGGDDRLAAGRGGMARPHAEERDLGGEVGGLARQRLRAAPRGGRRGPGEEAEHQREPALHGWRSVWALSHASARGRRARLYAHALDGWGEDSKWRRLVLVGKKGRGGFCLVAWGGGSVGVVGPTWQ